MPRTDRCDLANGNEREYEVSHRSYWQSGVVRIFSCIGIGKGSFDGALEPQRI
jgi:hypothetical protein